MFLRTGASLIGTALCLLLAADAATSAPVSYRSRTCGQGTTTGLTLAKPAGTVTNDVMIASIGTANANAVTSAPSGWTQVPGLSGQVAADQRLITFYKVATASEPGTYTFTSGSSIDGTAGGITTFANVDTIIPIAGTPAQSIQSSITTSDTLPNSDGTAPGSMRYSAVAMDDAGNQTFSAPMTTGCNEVNSAGTDVATATGWEPTGAGTTATRTVSRDDNGRSVMHTLVLMRQCGAGGLNLTAPSSISFPPTVLDGRNRTIAVTPAITVNDQSGDEAGWSLSATSTRFTNGTHVLPDDATEITPGTPTAGAGRCAAPTNSVPYPVGLPAGATPPTAAKIFNAANATGMGPTLLDLTFSLTIPGNVRIGNYTSTWTLTLSSGP